MNFSKLIISTLTIFLFNSLSFSQTYQLIDDGNIPSSLTQFIADIENNQIVIEFEDKSDSLSFEIVKSKVTEMGIYYFLYSIITDSCLTLFFNKETHSVTISATGMVLNYKFISYQSIKELRQNGF